MSKRDPSLLIHDMTIAIEAINKYCKNLTYSEFIADQKTIDAVLRNLTILGEAANRVPDDFRRHNPHIEWIKIARSRHVVVHNYFGVDLEIVWRIIEIHLPEVLNALRKF